MAIKVDPRCAYTRTHEWVRVEGEEAYAGVTDYAQQQLSDIVYFELSGDVGDSFSKGQVFGVIESVKAASDCYLPIAGEIVATNEELQGRPELINQEPYDAGWLVKIKVQDATQVDGLMNPEQYASYAAKAEQEGGH
jgi:glycine cleavage system H protein